MKTEQLRRKSPVKVRINKELDKLDVSKLMERKTERLQEILKKRGLAPEAKVE